MQTPVPFPSYFRRSSSVPRNIIPGTPLHTVLIDSPTNQSYPTRHVSIRSCVRQCPNGSVVAGIPWGPSDHVAEHAHSSAMQKSAGSSLSCPPLQHCSRAPQPFVPRPSYLRAPPPLPRPSVARHDWQSPPPPASSACSLVTACRNRSCQDDPIPRGNRHAGRW